MHCGLVISLTPYVMNRVQGLALVGNVDIRSVRGWAALEWTTVTTKVAVVKRPIQGAIDSVINCAPDYRIGLLVGAEDLPAPIPGRHGIVFRHGDEPPARERQPDSASTIIKTML